MTGDGDKGAAKKAINLSVRGSFLDEAREFRLNISAELERALSERLQEERRRRWLAEDEEAIALCNHSVGEDGTFSDKLRRF